MVSKAIAQKLALKMGQGLARSKIIVDTEGKPRRFSKNCLKE